MTIATIGIIAFIGTLGLLGASYLISQQVQNWRLAKALNEDMTNFDRLNNGAASATDIEARKRNRRQVINRGDLDLEGATHTVLESTYESFDDTIRNDENYSTPSFTPSFDVGSSSDNFDSGFDD